MSSLFSNLPHGKRQGRGLTRWCASARMSSYIWHCPFCFETYQAAEGREEAWLVVRCCQDELLYTTVLSLLCNLPGGRRQGRGLTRWYAAARSSSYILQCRLWFLTLTRRQKAGKRPDSVVRCCQDELWWLSERPLTDEAFSGDLSWLCEQEILFMTPSTGYGRKRW